MANDAADGDREQEATSVLDTVRTMFKELATLRITTTVTGDGEKTITTTVNLLGGDINNSIDEAFLQSDEMRSIRDFHAEQVKNGHAIIKGNVDMVIDLAKQLQDILT